MSQSSYPAEVRKWNFSPFFSAKGVVKFGVKFWWNFPCYVFQGLGVRGKFHQNFTSKTVWKTENFTQISLCWGAALTFRRVGILTLCEGEPEMQKLPGSPDCWENNMPKLARNWLKKWHRCLIQESLNLEEGSTSMIHKPGNCKDFSASRSRDCGTSMAFLHIET